jgi:ELWxxDGT repeat protein
MTNLVYFFTYDQATGQDALWKSDGTPGGTVEVTTATDSIYYAYELTDVGGKLYFSAYDQNLQQYQLWTSDGTPNGTVEVTPAMGNFTVLTN